MGKEESAALAAYLNSIAFDVLAWHADRQAAEERAKKLDRFQCLAFAAGVADADEVPAPSFRGSRQAAAETYALGLYQDTMKAHAAESGLEFDDDAAAAWVESFVRGVLSAE